MGLHRDNHAVCRRQRIDRNHTEGRHTVDQNRVIVLLDCIDIGSQRELPAHGVYQAHFHSRQLNVGWHKVNTLFVVQDALIHRKRLVADHLLHDGCKGGLQAVLILPAQASGEVALGVCVNEQNLLSQAGQPNAQIHRCGGFACSAFLVGQCDDTAFLRAASLFRHFHVLLFDRFSCPLARRTAMYAVKWA